MKVNIVRPRDGWVLQRIAEQWKIPGSKCSDRPDASADVNIWVNYALFKTVGRYRKTKCDIGYFTHREEYGPLRYVFDRVASRMDWCIAMCDQTAAHLPDDVTTVVHSSPHEQFRKESIVLGVCGRPYDRKGLDVIPELKQIPGIEVRYTGGKLRFEDLPEFYRGIDYLLVTSTNEGGPLPVLEAMAMGKPVIAPDVGWCWDYPVITYDDWNDLKDIVGRLVIPDVIDESAQIMEVIERACGLHCDI